MNSLHPSIIQSYETDPWRNLALEDYLMGRCAQDTVLLYLWQNQHTIVIGKNQNPWKECRCELFESEDGRLARRSSGGGTVYHDLGNLNFTFIASPFHYDLHRQLSVIIGACNALGIAAEFTGRNDITVDGRKFSGNAFKKTSRCSMQHGTVLICADLQKLGKYLQPSAEKMKSKGIESVRSRVCNLTEYRADLTPERMREVLCEQFEKEYGKASILNVNELDSKAIDMLYEKYASWEWRYGISPKFDVELYNRFEWGEIVLDLNLADGRITAAKVFTDAMDADLADLVAAALPGCVYGTPMAERLAALDVNEEAKPLAKDIADWLFSKEF